MKKLTKLMAILMALCLITSSFVGSTLAKYVTSDTSTASARVAKFGVTVVAAGDELFNNQYIGTDDAVTVKSSDDAKVVAPGTSTNGDGLTFTIAGTPEVAVKFTYTFTVTDDIFLKSGKTYPDYTTGDAADTYAPAEDYYPVVYTLKKDGGVVKTGNLAAIKSYFDTLSTDVILPGNTLDAVYNLTWAWDFNDPDQADTALGNFAADAATFAVDSTGAALTDGEDYNLDTAYSHAIAVTQVD